LFIYAKTATVPFPLGECTVSNYILALVNVNLYST